MNLAETIDLATIELRAINIGASNLDAMEDTPIDFDEEIMGEEVVTTDESTARAILRDYTFTSSIGALITFKDYQQKYVNVSRDADFQRWEDETYAVQPQEF